MDSKFKSQLATYYRNGIKQTLFRAGKNAFSQGVPFIWCSNNLLVDLIIQIHLYEKMTGDQQFKNTSTLYGIGYSGEIRGVRACL